MVGREAFCGQLCRLWTTAVVAPFDRPGLSVVAGRLEIGGRRPTGVVAGGRFTCIARCTRLGELPYWARTIAAGRVV